MRQIFSIKIALDSESSLLVYSIEGAPLHVEVNAIMLTHIIFIIIPVYHFLKLCVICPSFYNA